MSDRLTIGELARTAGVPASTVRYYERTGLLRRPPRSQSNYRTSLVYPVLIRHLHGNADVTSRQSVFHGG